MADKLDLDEGEELDRDEIRVRCSKALKRKMEGIAAAEERARELRGKGGKISLNRLMKLVIERYAVSWASDNKTAVPESEEDQLAVERGAVAINARREREAKKKSK